MDTTTTTISDVLRLIATKSLRTSGQATRGLREVARPESRPIQYALELALLDPDATFTQEERTMLTEHLTSVPDELRILELRLQVNVGDKQQIQTMADTAEMSVSNFIRQKIGLPVL
jgi:hypothetical protein